MAKSTVSARSGKETEKLPVFKHQTGRWAKKVHQKFRYFGRIADDPDGSKAKALWEVQKDDLLAGREPRPKTEGALALKDLVNRFLTAKKRLMESREISPRTFSENYATAERMLDLLGKDRPVTDLTTDDFGQLRASLAKTRGPVALGNEIQRVRSIFKFAKDEALIPEAVNFGQQFKKPSRKAVRIAKAESGSRMFEAEELVRIMSACNPTLKAMVLMAANAGFGQHDIASLPISALDMKKGFVTFPRPKTGIERRAKLWPETTEAIQAVLDTRRTPRDPADSKLVFLTEKGKRYIRENTSDDPEKWSHRTDLIGNAFAKVLRKLGINGRRGFYAIRHSHQTAGELCGDMPAVKFVMGHVDASMSGTYRDRIEDSRLVKEADAVHAWLWPAPVKPAKRSTKSRAAR